MGAARAGVVGLLLLLLLPGLLLPGLLLVPDLLVPDLLVPLLVLAGLLLLPAPGWPLDFRLGGMLERLLCICGVCEVRGSARLVVAWSYTWLRCCRRTECCWVCFRCLEAVLWRVV